MFQWIFRASILRLNLFYVVFGGDAWRFGDIRSPAKETAVKYKAYKLIC